MPTTPHAALMISAVRDYNPDTGPTYVWTFAGTEAQMNAVAADYEQLGAGAPIGYGYKTNLIKTAAGVILTVRIPDDILYTTRWNFNSSVTSVPAIWTEEVFRAMPWSSGVDVNTLDGLETLLWRFGLLTKAASLVKSGQNWKTPYDEPVPSGGRVAYLGPITEPESRLLFQIVRDGEYFEFVRPTLKRCRTIPVGLFDVRTRQVGRPLLYSLDGIYNSFGLTDDAYDQAVTIYDNLPTAYPNTKWSWKLCENDSDTVVGSGKVQETRNWIFGRWSTISNTFVA